MFMQIYGVFVDCFKISQIFHNEVEISNHTKYLYYIVGFLFQITVTCHHAICHVSKVSQLTGTPKVLFN